jgi:hypothetical protein
MAIDDYSDLQKPDSQYAGPQNPGTLYAAKGAKAPAKTTGPKFKIPKKGEVTILTTYDWKPKIDDKTEIDYLLDHKWHPWYADYVEITKVKMASTPGDLLSLLGMICEYKPKSIKRLNFFTHANKKLIGIVGYLDSTGVTFTSYTDEKEINDHVANGLTFTYNGQSYSLDDVRERFADKAIFILYGCDVAFDPTTLLTALKDLFQVTVIGFRDKTVFCPPAQTRGASSFNRKGEKMGVMKKDFSCKKDSKTDWRSLITDPNAVTIPK